MNQKSLLEIATFTPFSLAAPAAWAGHLPFAAWIMGELSPGIFVELGTHTGNSYFSFCQAAAEFKVASKCYAVDTWQGDEHAGQYDNSIFVKVNEHNESHYAAFSRLLRMTFDDAASYFEDGSVALLHIDGLHTYEAVRHDFETWLPKLAPGAVVLFHDTNVRERGFGVWKLWQELQERYPANLEFAHSNGLGVLQLNDTPESQKLDWLTAEQSEKQLLRAYFSALGAHQAERLESTRRMDEQEKNFISEKQEILFEKAQQSSAFNELGLAFRNLESQMQSIFQSTSWRITSPLRKIGAIIKRR